MKHSNDVPGCALAIEQIFDDVGFPDHAFQTILADHDQVSQLIENDMISGVSLTGSTLTGKKIARLAGENLKNV